MKTRTYNKKILSLLALSLVANAMMAGSALSDDGYSIPVGSEVSCYGAGFVHCGFMGIFLPDEEDLTLGTGSLVQVTSSATVHDAFDGVMVEADAYGIYAYSESHGPTTVTLMASADNYQMGVGIGIEDVAEATINIDATSWVSGNDFAIISVGSNTTVNNSGTVKGRIVAEELNNSATGVLEETLAADDSFNVGGANDEGEFYNIIGGMATANLADGSTVSVVMADDNLGLLAPRDSEEYRILTAVTGNWNEAKVNLQQANNYYSPLLGLTWSNLSDENNLVMKATFLTPAQAGLTANATAAFYAAYADGLFNFDSNPEDWTPDVSGANVFGKTQFIGSSRYSIEKRLRDQQSGVGSGDAAAMNGVWADVRSTSMDQDESDDIEGFDGDTTSFTFGYDRQITSEVTLGAALSYGDSDADTDVSNEKYDMEDYLLSVYGGYDVDSWFAEGQLSYGWGDVDGKRRLLASTLTSSYDSNIYYAKVGGGLKYNVNGVQVLPQASLDYTKVKFDDYREKGGYMALNVEHDDYDMANLGLGVQLLKSFTMNRVMLTPDASAMVYYDLIGDDIETTSTFVGGTHAFTTTGADADRTTFDLGLGLTIGGVECPASFRVGYEYIDRGDFESHNFSGKLRYEF